MQAAYDNLDRDVLFLSHAAADAEIAAVVKREVEQCFPFVTVFVSTDPEELPPGSPWVETILENLEAAKIVAVLATSRALTRKWVWFERVIAERTSKVRKLLEWRGKEITVTLPVKSMVITATVSKIVETTERFAAVLSGCSQFYVSAEVREGLPGLKSWPVEAVFIGFDNEHKRLELIVADELSIKRVKY
ncbi:MAG: TIR domain-containing protein [Candidatus Acidiferrales bacterium]